MARTMAGGSNAAGMEEISWPASHMLEGGNKNLNREIKYWPGTLSKEKEAARGRAKSNEARLRWNMS